MGRLIEELDWMPGERMGFMPILGEEVSGDTSRGAAWGPIDEVAFHGAWLFTRHDGEVTAYPASMVHHVKLADASNVK